MNNELILKKLRTEFKKASNPEYAPEMQAYMKSKMPFYGIMNADRTPVYKKVFADLEFKNFKEWESLVTTIWDNAKFREERYAALTLACDRRAREFQTPKAMRLYEKLVVTGAWWDYVDGVADFIRDIMKEYPGEIKPLMRKWAVCDNMWKRRVAIISQLKFKKDTDLKLLYFCIEKNWDSKEFFIQKAIGWALREYAWTNPKEIKRYVAKNKKHLAPLSQREALKNILKNKIN